MMFPCGVRAPQPGVLNMVGSPVPLAQNSLVTLLSCYCALSGNSLSPGRAGAISSLALSPWLWLQSQCTAGEEWPSTKKASHKGRTWFGVWGREEQFPELGVFDILDPAEVQESQGWQWS